MDDAQGCKTARQRGIHVLGCIRVVLHAKRLELIPTAWPVLESLAAAGYRVDERLVRKALKEAGGV